MLLETESVCFQFFVSDFVLWQEYHNQGFVHAQ